MNPVTYGKHKMMAPSLVEIEIRGQDDSRRTWFWFDGSRQEAREQVRERIERQLDRMNRGKHEKNRLTVRDLNVYVDGTKMQSLVDALPGTVEP